MQSPSVPPDGAADLDNTDCVGSDLTATLDNLAMKLLIEKDRLSVPTQLMKVEADMFNKSE